MAKYYKTFEVQQPGPSHATTGGTDWSKCVICQTTTKEALCCPAESTRQDVGLGYSTLASHLVRFKDLHEMPLPIDIENLDEGKGLEAAFTVNKAKWHKTCRLKFNTTKLQRAEKRHSTEDLLMSSKKYTRLSIPGCSTQATSRQNIEACFFCDKPSTYSEPLHLAATFGLDANVRKCVIQLQDERLIAKLSEGDLVAQDAKYHVRCLSSLYNRCRVNTKPNLDSCDKVLHGIALAELVMYIEEARDNDEVSPVFRLADLNKLYTTRLEQLRVQNPARIHSTRLKERLLAHIPGLCAHQEGRDILMAFDSDIGLALRKAYEKDSDEDGLCLTAAANVVRRDMFQQHDDDQQRTAVPQSLLSLVSMILSGPSIKSTADCQVALTIAQILQFNSAAQRGPESKSMYHSISRETPTPVYTAMKIHAETRKRKLVDAMCELGLSVSYERLMDISTNLGNRVCEQYCTENVVCPPNLERDQFTTAAVDNIDHNPSSNTAKGAFHGTGISLFQHPDAVGDVFNRRDDHVSEGPSQLMTKFELPESYTSVASVILKKNDFQLPDTGGPVTGGQNDVIERELKKEKRWLEHVEQSCHINNIETINEDSNVSWAAYHASHSETEIKPAITALLPLFPEDSKSPGMIRHALDVIKVAVHKLNPGQVPVVTLDQPLYAIAKQIQWTWPEQYGESQYVIMLGGLHIEMAALKVLGDWLEDSGWVEALTQANVSSPGRAESFLKASHVKRTRYAHQVTACSLYILLKRSYANCRENEEQDLTVSFEDWCKQRAQSSPQFLFWYLALQLQLLVMSYIRSLRERNFTLYIESLTKLAPWFFTTGHIHYARWVPVHIRDMVRLKEALPDVAKAFEAGHFTVQKTRRPFSAMAIDQAHEQNNAAIKGDGGAVSLLQSSDALRRWMVAGPEIARYISEFEDAMDLATNTMNGGGSMQHHEQSTAFQKKFACDISSLVHTVEEMGNPFLEEGGDLLKLDNGNVVDSSVITVLQHAEQTGHQQCDEFIKERLVERSKMLMEPIKKNKLSLFSRSISKATTQAKSKVSSLKSDCSLFARLYISCQTRDGNLDDFFSHENQACPPSLSNLGNLRHGTKSDILDCLEKSAASTDKTPEIDVILLDGAAIVNMLRPTNVKTFDEYASNVFVPFLEKHLKTSRRIDIIWDVYINNSLKSQTRSERGKGMRRRVQGSSRIPVSWHQFLRIDENKTELFQFLSKHAIQIESEKLIVATNGKDVLSNHPYDTDQLSPCSHEEADTRIFVHLAEVARQGLKRALVRTVDSDVVVLAIAALNQVEVNELWVGFGTGAKFRYMPIHEIATALGPEKSLALPMFHAYTGCDTVSSFGNIGKRTAWEAWKMFDDVTSAFIALGKAPASIVDEHFARLERFTILLYNRTSTLTNVNDERKYLFSKKGRTMFTIPPTRDALLQHTKRAVYQGGHCWGKLFEKTPSLPCPSHWGWTNPEQWKPLWTILPEASIASRQLLKCSCKTVCSGRCSCKKAALPCTALCQCSC